MEDYIDFPCSPTWLDWYHEIGLTPRRSGRNAFNEKLVEHLEKLNRRLDAQERLLRKLYRRRRPKKKKRGTSPRPPALENLKEVDDA